MAQQIHILPEDLCNKIAAGEVVERPSSVVKELVENSLDAGADHIRIEVEKGGRKLIRVHDNGRGMSREDAFLCLERHATSKIQNDQDMFALETLGFRGEALPSIASVSRFTLRTAAPNAEAGTEIRVEGGTVRHAEDVGFPTGTQIEVMNLFFNTPARRKFLRREETEIGHIADIITKQALARPDVHFYLSHNGRVLIDARREKTLLDRVGMLLGRQLPEELIALEVEGQDGLSCTGLIGPPTLTRSTTGSIYTYINGRFVRDKVVQHAILDAYRNLLMRGRYPVVILFLTIEPSEVDVNVHPTKHEVRFRQQRQVHDFICDAVRNRLREGASRHAWSDNSSTTYHPSGPPPTLKEAPGVETDHGPREKAPAVNTVASLPFTTPRVAESEPSYSIETPGESSEKRTPEDPSPDRPSTEDSELTEQGGFFQQLDYIGQFQGTYLIAEHGAELVLIDQHAAHERVTFEGLKRQFREGGVQSQALMFPKVIEFDFKAVDALERILPELEHFGFDLEHFGGRSFTLKSVPQLLAEGDPEPLLQDVAQDIIRYSDSRRVEEQLDDVLIRMACHSSVRAHQRLTETEVIALFKSLDGIDFNAHCPHGRPVVQRLTLADVERMFRRV